MIYTNNLYIAGSSNDNVLLSGGEIKYENGDFLGKIKGDIWHSFTTFPSFKIKSKNITQVVSSFNPVQMIFDTSTVELDLNYFDFDITNQSLIIKDKGNYLIAYNIKLNLVNGRRCNSQGFLVRETKGKNINLGDSYSFGYHYSTNEGYDNLTSIINQDMLKDDRLKLYCNIIYNKKSSSLTTTDNGISLTILKINTTN